VDGSVNATYHVSAVPPGQEWLVGRATEARTLNGLTEMVRDMLGLLLDIEDTSRLELSWRYDLPADLAGSVEQAIEARETYRSAEKQLATTGRAAARSLTAAGVSLRDAAAILGLSFQRVAQLADETSTSRRRTSRRQSTKATGRKTTVAGR
jgi:hypothetical protein